MPGVILKAVLILTGTVSLGIGLTGIFVPGLPTTPFLLLSAALYLHSSEKMYRRLMNNRVTGRFISEFAGRKGMTAGLKIVSIAVMWLMILLTVFLFTEKEAWKIVLVVAGFTGTIVMGFLVPTARD